MTSDRPLDSDQQKFCSIEGGRVCLLAPAGCGKTHSLLWRCLHLAEASSLEKPRFLIFTFTKAACDEIRDRLRQQSAFKDIASLVTVMTLNSWGNRFIRPRLVNPQLINDTSSRLSCIKNFLQSIWTDHERINAVLSDNKRSNSAGQAIMETNDLLKSLGFRHDLMETEKDIKRHFEYLDKCRMSGHSNVIIERLSDLEVITNRESPHEEMMKYYINFWKKATEFQYESAMISFDDQKYWALIELEKQLKQGQFTSGGGRYHYILVDEFQDINPLDLNLLKTIAESNKAELTIIGDDDQAIYEWRGASPSFILDPPAYIGGKYTTCILGTNYRSPKNIVELSQKLISCNKRRIPKKVSAASNENAQVQVKRFTDTSGSTNFTLELVNSLLNDRSIQNIALIGRKRSQIIPYQIIFAGQDTPFYAAEDLQVLLSQAFKQLQDTLAIRARAKSGPIAGINPVNDLLSICNRVKRYPLSKADRESVGAHLRQDRPRTITEAIESLRRYSGPLKRSKNDQCQMSTQFADAVSNLLSACTVSESIQAISNNFEGLQKDYGKSLEDIFYVDPPFLHLSDYARRYGEDYDRFYEDIEQAIATLAKIPPEDDEGDSSEWKAPLHLMTSLRAKGKEFDVVIVLDANDGIWPIRLADTDEHFEQERRLFYVAMTRAKKQLYFLVNDKMLGNSMLPSPYLAEMGLSVPDTTND